MDNFFITLFIRTRKGFFIFQGDGKLCVYGIKVFHFVNNISLLLLYHRPQVVDLCLNQGVCLA